MKIFTDTMVLIQIQLECNCKKKWRHFPIKLKVLLKHIYNKIEDNRIIFNSEDIFENENSDTIIGIQIQLEFN